MEAHEFGLSENAEQYLELADDALREEQERYDQLQAEEALYRIEQELAKVQVQQEELLTATEAAWAERGPEDSFSRHQRVGMRKLSAEQDSLSEQLDPIVTEIENEGSPVFGRRK